MFENKYPYTDFHEMNLDWILEKINEIDKKVENIESSILDQAKAYADAQITERLAGVESEFADLQREVFAAIADLNGDFDEFKGIIYSRLAITDNNFRRLEDRVNSVLAEANAYTNYAILQNNEYIIDQTTKALSTVTVLNYFTGERVSIQAMFDYLAQFHLDNAITYQEFFAADKTYNEIIALDADYTSWAINGKTIIQ